jgi:hypothetical protein
MEAFGIKGRPSELLSMLPLRVHNGLTCPWCPDQKLVSRHKSRDAHAREHIPYCQSCSHLHQTAGCPCANCATRARTARLAAEDRKRALVWQHYELPLQPPGPPLALLGKSARPTGQLFGVHRT